MTRGLSCSRLFAVAAFGVAVACAVNPHPRTQHIVDGEVVSSPPPSPNEYAAYARVRLAIETPGADLEPARHDLQVLLVREPNDPHLWVTKAELEHKAGDAAAARAALDRALALQPDYAPALAFRDQIDSGRPRLEAARSQP